LFLFGNTGERGRAGEGRGEKEYRKAERIGRMEWQ
jgi:hypothetical protein